MMAEVFVGIDVSKDRLDVQLRPLPDAFAVKRDDGGIEELIARLRDIGPALVVLEATGGYETVVAGALVAAGLPLAVVNPRRIREFAKAVGKLAKTDRLDAAVIAHFAEAVRPPPRAVADAEAQALGELVARRRQVIEMMVAERNRARLVGSAASSRRSSAIWPCSRRNSRRSTATLTPPSARARPGTPTPNCWRASRGLARRRCGR